ncbi:MAG: hypothetical protein Q9217_001772 [Psora testacea]
MENLLGILAVLYRCIWVSEDTNTVSPPASTQVLHLRRQGNMSSAAEVSHPHFKRILRFNTEYSPTTITQYESTRTGMRIVVVDQEGPKINGYFTLATEIHDDSGAPHTLEHLCFMGSKNYRYKGVLDKLATRAYSNTNAWTATDHTAYTLDTAGWEGFAQILPVYLEHVIIPTLTDASCYTEVHHIDPDGNDAGVVYSEMQGVQNTQGELMDLKYKRLMYPEGIGFRYETGGMMEQLRILSADRIRDFHKEMYQPKNLCLILVGPVDHANLLGIVNEFESTILSDIPKPGEPFKRPWVGSKQTPPLQKSVIETVEFPEEDESTGEIMISFFGPSYDDNLLGAAMIVLLRYLAGTSASVLDNTMVEKEQLVSGVYYTTEFRPNTIIQFALSSVATEEMNEVEARFFEILRDTAAKPLDMKYLQDCISVERRQVKFQAESSAQFFTEPVIRDFLFGQRDAPTLQRDLQSLKDYDDLENWADAEWRHWMRTWLSEGHHVTILGKPSAQLSERLKREEKVRVEARKKELGEDGLKHLAEKLARAQAENDREIPKGFLERFKVPGPDSITFINTTTARSGAAKALGKLDNPIQMIIDRDESELPLFIHFEHVKSNFAYLNILLGTEKIPIRLRPLLVIYMENFFAAPMMRDSKRIDFEEVIMELERDSVGYGIDSGTSLGNSETINVFMQAEVEKYETAIRWFQELMFQSIFDIGRLDATLARLLAEIPDEKRSGSDMANCVDEMIIASPASIVRARGTLVRAVYLKQVKKLLQTEPETVISQLKEINKALCHPANFRVLVVADVEKLDKPVSAWKALTKGLDNSKPLNQLETRYSRLNSLGQNPRDTAYFVPMPTIDSSFLLADAKGPNSLFDPSMPALLVAASYLNAVEGPLWTAVRGTGLAYGTSIRLHTMSGQISLDIYRSPDASKAFSASKKVLEDFVSDKTSFDKLALEGAISSIVLGFANSEATMASAATISFVRQVVRGLPKNWPKIMLERVRKVTFEEIKQAMKNIIMPIFRPETSILVVTCAPIMREGLVKDFEGMGYKPQVKPLAFFQDDYGLGVENGEDEEEDDGDEHEDGEDEDEEDENGEDEDNGHEEI